MSHFHLMLSVCLAGSQIPAATAPPTTPQTPAANPRPAARSVPSDPPRSATGAAAASPPELVPLSEESQALIQQRLGRSLTELVAEYSDKQAPESVRMLLAIARGSQMGAGDGWFGPANSRYGYDWLVRQQGLDAETPLTRDRFSGPAAWLARLDRNQDGQVTREDLDWSDRNPWVSQAYMINRLFRRMDPDGDGLLTRDQWLQFFDRASADGVALRSEELVEKLLAGVGGSFAPGDAPEPDLLVRGLFAGEIGSLQEGPRVNQPAPDFSLKTHDGRETIRLADLVGQKPIVLTFGNFTCGPFRSMFPGVESVYRRFHDEAIFLTIYVREAHPTDGWKMESNTRVGVEVAQPRNYGERVDVAARCHGLLKCSMPLLVDEIDDRVGNAYSGMPARLYVIDRAGRVAYQSGRGPFGFRTGEMEQALVMCLLEAQSPAGSVPR